MKLIRSNCYGPYTNLEQFENEFRLLQAKYNPEKKIENVRYGQLINFKDLEDIKRTKRFIEEFLQMKKDNPEATKEELTEMVSMHAMNVVQEINLNKYLQSFVQNGVTDTIVVFIKNSGERFIIDYNEIQPSELDEDERVRYEEALKNEVKEVTSITN